MSKLWLRKYPIEVELFNSKENILLYSVFLYNIIILDELSFGYCLIVFRTSCSFEFMVSYTDLFNTDTCFEHSRKHTFCIEFRFGKIGFSHSFLHTGDAGCYSFDQVHTGK